MQNDNATASAHLITISKYPQPATVVKLAPMAYKRAFHTSVVTPDGKIFVFGGQVGTRGLLHGTKHGEQVRCQATATVLNGSSNLWC